MLNSGPDSLIAVVAASLVAIEVTVCDVKYVMLQKPKAV